MHTGIPYDKRPQAYTLHTMCMASPERLKCLIHHVSFLHFCLWMKYNHNSRLSIRKAPMVYSSCYTPHWQQWWSLPRHVACCRVAAAGNCCLLHPSPGVQTSASKSSIRRFVITEKAPTRALSWLKAATTAFTFKTLLRHYANQSEHPLWLLCRGPNFTLRDRGVNACLA